MDVLWQFEILINVFFQHLGNWLLLPMKAISFLGQEEFFLVVMPAIYWCVDSRNGLRLGLMLMATTCVNGWLKLAFHHPRPYWLDQRVSALATEASFGMPSGHSQSAIAMWGYLSRIYRQNKTILYLAAGVIFLTGISRIYLGVHFLDQVVVGWLVGAALIWFFVHYEAALLRLVHKLALVQLIAGIFLISMGMIGVNFMLASAAGAVPVEWQVAALTASDAPIDPLDTSGIISLAGTSMGLAAGAAWDWRKNGQPATKGAPLQKIFRYLLGLAGLAAVYVGLKLIFPDSIDLLGLALRYVRYAMVGLWVTVFAPSLFRRLRLV